MDVQERRKFERAEFIKQVAIRLLQPKETVAHVNLGEGGLCLRLEKAPEVRSVVRLQLTPTPGIVRSRSGRTAVSMQCRGRVAWVVQRLDLRDHPPFLFDVGIEFVDPPPMLRQWIVTATSRPAGLSPHLSRSRQLRPVTIRGREYIPRVQRESQHTLPWHLIVRADGVPCLSTHYPTERKAVEAWARFRRRGGKPTRREAKPI